MKKPLIITLLILLFSCGKKEKSTENQFATSDSSMIKNKTLQTENNQSTKQILLETFGFPAEINGCSCYFAANKEDFNQEKYIYIDDYGNSAYLKINGKMVKIAMEEGDFDPENFSKVIKNDEFTITIKGKKLKEQEEAMIFEGTMIVENNKGEKTITPIYGECGC